MVQIFADNKDTEKTLKRLEKLTSQNGGWVHPDLQVFSKKGDLSVEFEDDDYIGSKLVSLTRDVLLPVNDVEIFAEKGKLNFKPVDSKSLSKVRHELFELVFELYNETDKIKLTRETNFWLSLKDDQHIMDHLTKARTTGEGLVNMKKFLNKDDDDEEIVAYITDRFISTRILGLNAGKNGKEGSEKMPVLMPVIDFFNHHDRGGRFHSPDSDTLEVSCRKPVEGSNECFGFYGFMDAFDTYLRYGFVDSHAAIIRSVPLTIDIPNIGRIVVESRTPHKTSAHKLSKKAQDLEGFIPLITNKHDVMTLSHLYIPISHSPYALRRVLGSCISLLLSTEEQKKDLRKYIKEAEKHVVDVNLSFYKKLEAKLKAIKKEKNYKSKTALDMALLLSKTQRQKLKSYTTMQQEEDS